MIWPHLKRSLTQLFYPAQCLHCQDFIEPGETVFCSACMSLLELIDPEERCQTCFEILPTNSSHACAYCKKHPSLFYRCGAAFDYIGPAASLVKRLKYGNQPHLAKGIAAYLVMQFIQLDWPFPDALIPVPISFTHWLDRGYNQSALIAEEMAHLLKVPILNVLKRKSGDFSQASLTVDQRYALKNQTFKLKKRHCIKDQTLLLIDDVVTSGTTLNKCAESLMAGHPATLYALSFCKTSLKHF